MFTALNKMCRSWKDAERQWKDGEEATRHVQVHIVIDIPGISRTKKTWKYVHTPGEMMSYGYLS